MKLTNKDKKIYQFIKEYLQKEGESPTLNEIKKFFDYKSLTSVQKTLNVLEIYNLIERNKFQQRSISITEKGNDVVDIPLVGNVACGAPLLATENIEGYIPTDKTFITTNIQNYFYLRAVGDSMDLAGIKNGNLVLIKKQNNAENGQKIVALINDEATIKILKRETDFIALVPKSSNPSHKPILLHNGSNLAIQGVVVKAFGL